MSSPVKLLLLFQKKKRNPINITFLCSVSYSSVFMMEMFVPPPVNLPLEQETPGSVTHVDLSSGSFWFRPDFLLSRIGEIEQTLHSLLSGVSAG